MRISDWSSDVCSSDLTCASIDWIALPSLLVRMATTLSAQAVRLQRQSDRVGGCQCRMREAPAAEKRTARTGSGRCQIGRAWCRERCVSTCRSRWAPYKYKHNYNTIVFYT